MKLSHRLRRTPSERSGGFCDPRAAARARRVGQREQAALARLGLRVGPLR